MRRLRLFWRCWLGIHDYSICNQHALMTERGLCDVVIAWRNCSRCYKTKLIHILK